jgi:hypothetical protein
MSTFPSGSDKGKPVSEGSDNNVKWWAVNARSEDFREECAAEARKRGLALGDEQDSDEEPVVGGQDSQQGQPAQAQRPAATSRVAPNTSITTVVGEAVAAGGNLMKSLEKLSANCIVVTPTAAIDSLPEGCSISISLVKIDPTSEGYALTGNKESPKPTDHIGLGKTAIERIGGGYGASWIPELTGRKDDAKDPHYCCYQAWSECQDLDGTMRRYPGECEIDLRDGSPQALDIVRKAESNNRDPKKQLAEARKFIQRTCMSKAMLVALRRPGLRHWYTRQELDTKPFAVVKLMFHGRTEDPVYKPMFAKLIAERFGAARTRLFNPKPQVQTHSAPPVGSVRVVDIEGEESGEPRCPF